MKKLNTNEIPEGYELFEPEGDYVITYNESWDYLCENLTPLEFKITHNLSMCININNSLEPLSYKSTNKDIMSVINISINKIKPLFNRLIELGIISYLPNNKRNHFYIFNPYITHKQGFVFTKEIISLFKNSYFYNLFNYKLSTQSLDNVSDYDNLYILAQELPDNTLYKLGYSSKIKNRLKQYLYHNPSIQIIKTFRKEDAKQFEKDFHKNNKSVYLNEWYLYDSIKNLFD